MASSVTDLKTASLAAGFTLGFGFLSCWTAIKQTRRVAYPLRSAYVWMVWGEILANLGIGILGWLFLEGVVPQGVPVLFGLLFFWVFEIQLLMQIIINRIIVVAEDKQRVVKIKWGTALIITAINITVFCIWIPAHLSPPVSETYVRVNRYWDPISKVLICIVDAALNIWFVRIVRQRLVRYHHLTKYAPLVRFNSYLMVVSIAMDILLIGLMFLKNQLVYVQFHPVTYIVKLNIEMSMAALIAKLARQSLEPNVNEYVASHSSSHGLHTTAANRPSDRRDSSMGHPLQALRRDDRQGTPTVKNGNIHAKTDIYVRSEGTGGRGQPSLGCHRPARPTSKEMWEDDDVIPLKDGSWRC